MKREWPLTSDDLRRTADRIDEVLAVVGPEGDYMPDNDWRWGLTVTVWNPDGDDDDIAGTIAPYGDGWIGFYPKGIPVPRTGKSEA